MTPLGKKTPAYTSRKDILETATDKRAGNQEQKED